MTLFSYVVSVLVKDNFKEPELLGILIKRLGADLNKPLATLAGWQIHYAVGVIFVTVYTLLWERKALRPGLKSGIFLGLISGVIGIGFWKIVFTLHPDPPRIQLKKYYVQLLLAHVLFGIGSAWPQQESEAGKIAG